MGWKNVKEHYRIGHIVHVTKEGLCIGSPYIHNIIAVGDDGTFKKRFDRGNVDLDRYQREMEADPAKFRELMAAPDTFAASIPVFTYEGGRIIEKRCEEPGWPNVTHDGELMYENTFSTNKAKVVKLAKRCAESGVVCWTRNIADARARLAECEKELAQANQELAQLRVDYPDESQH